MKPASGWRERIVKALICPMNQTLWLGVAICAFSGCLIIFSNGGQQTVWPNVSENLLSNAAIVVKSPSAQPTQIHSAVSHWPASWASWLWLLGWAIIAARLSWQIRSQRPNRLAYGRLAMVAIAIVYLGWWIGWLIPLIPAWSALLASAALVTLKQAWKELASQRSQRFLAQVIQVIPQPVVVKDRRYRWLLVNQACAELLGRSAAEVIGQSDEQIFPPRVAEQFRRQDECALQSTGQITGDRGVPSDEFSVEFINLQGVTHRIYTTRSVHRDSAGNPFLISMMRTRPTAVINLTVEADLLNRTAELCQSNRELRLSQDRLHYLAHHDPLTGLPNRSFLYQHLREAIVQARQQSQAIGVLFLDLDGFKEINDTFGHSMGDVLLQSVAQRLQGCLRSSDILARMGGDEFIILLPTLSKKQQVLTVVNKVRLALAQEFMILEQPRVITVSIGISLFPDHADHLEVLIQTADEAMYRAKRSGKNCYAFAVRSGR